MKHERWRQAEELFHAALERAPEERQSFLGQACGEDTEIRREQTQTAPDGLIVQAIVRNLLAASLHVLSWHHPAESLPYPDSVNLAVGASLFLFPNEQFPRPNKTPFLGCTGGFLLQKL